MTDTHDVFISYSSKDAEAAHAVRDALVDAGLTCWMAPDSIREGESWAAAISRGIERARSFVLVLTGHSNASKQVAREVGLADKNDIPVVAFRIEDVTLSDALDYYLNSTHWLDVQGDDLTPATERLTRAIEAIVHADPQAPRAVPVSTARRSWRRRVRRALKPVSIAAVVVVLAYSGWRAAAAPSVDVAFEIRGGPPDAVTIDEAAPVAFSLESDVAVAERVVVTVDLPPGVTTEDGASTWTETWDAFGRGRNVEARLVALSRDPFDLKPRVFVDGLLADLDVLWHVEVRAPRLVVELEAPDRISLCEPLHARLVVLNDGDADGVISGITLRPEGLSHAFDGESFGTPITVPPSESREFALALTPDRPGDVTLAVDVDAEHHAVLRDEITTAVLVPDLHVVVEGPDDVYLGREVTYRVTVSNAGTLASEQTKLRWPVPQETTFVSATRGGVLHDAQVVWALDTLAPGQTVDVECTIQVTTPGDVAIRAAVEAACSENVTSAEVVTAARGVAAVLLEVIDIVDPVALGEEVTYVVTATNTGSAADHDLSVSVDLPAALRLVSATGATAATDEGDTVVFAPLDSLGAKEKVTWRLTCRTIDDGAARIKVRMASEQVPTPLVESCTTTVYPPDAQNLVVLNSEFVVMADPIVVGDRTTFVLTVTNWGNAPATNVTVAVDVPAELRFESSEGATARAADTGTPARVRFEPLAELPRKGQASWRVVATGITAEQSCTTRASITADGLSETVKRQSLAIYE